MHISSRHVKRQEESSYLQLLSSLYLTVRVGHAFSSQLVLSSSSREDSCFLSYPTLTAPSNSCLTGTMWMVYFVLPCSPLELFGINKRVWVYFCNYKAWHTQFTIALQPTYWGGYAIGIYSPEVCPNLRSDNSHKQVAVSHPISSNHPWTPRSICTAHHMAENRKVSSTDGYAHANYHTLQAMKRVLQQLPWIMEWCGW